MRRSAASWAFEPHFVRHLLQYVSGTEDPFASAVGLNRLAQEPPQTLTEKDRLSLKLLGAGSLGLPWAILPLAQKIVQRSLGAILSPRPLNDRLNDPREKEKQWSAIKTHLEQNDEAVLHYLHDGTLATDHKNRILTILRSQIAPHLAIDPALLAPGDAEWEARTWVREAAKTLHELLQPSTREPDEPDSQTAQQKNQRQLCRLHLYPQTIAHTLLLPRTLREVLQNTKKSSLAPVGIYLPAELPESQQLLEQLLELAPEHQTKTGQPLEVTILDAKTQATEKVRAIQTGIALPVLEDPVAVQAALIRLTKTALKQNPVTPKKNSAAHKTGASLHVIVQSENPLLRDHLQKHAAKIDTENRLTLQARAGIQLQPNPTNANHETPEQETHTNKQTAIKTLNRTIVPATWQKQLHAASHYTIQLLTEALTKNSEISFTTSNNQTQTTTKPLQSTPNHKRFTQTLTQTKKPGTTTHTTQHRGEEWAQKNKNTPLFYKPPAEPATHDTGGLTAQVLALSEGETGDITLKTLTQTQTIPTKSTSGFACEPDTDATNPANRAWIRNQLKPETKHAPHHIHPQTIELPKKPEDRAKLLNTLALAVAHARAELLAVYTHETNTPPQQNDREINETINQLRYLANLTEQLGNIRGAQSTPPKTALIASDNTADHTEQTAATLAALAAGTRVLWIASKTREKSTKTLLRILRDAGLPKNAVRFQPLPENPDETANTLVHIARTGNPARATFHGKKETALKLAARLPELPLELHASTPGCTLITPSANLIQAAHDTAKSALTGLPSRRIKNVILLGSVWNSKTFHQELTAAYNQLQKTATKNTATKNPQQSKTVQPVQATQTTTHHTSTIGHIHLHRARTLTQAIQLQNTLAEGKTQSLHARTAYEIRFWLEHATAANLTINKPTSNPRTERQPTGTTANGTLGNATLTGGPNWLYPLCKWQPKPGTPSHTLHLRGLREEIRLLIETASSSLNWQQFDEIRRAALADALTWRTRLGIQNDEIGLGIERNILRYWPVETHIRLAENGHLADLLRVLAAGLEARAALSVSSSNPLPRPVRELLTRLGISAVTQNDDAWLENLNRTTTQNNTPTNNTPTAPTQGRLPARIRLIGGNRTRTALWLAGKTTTLWAEPVTMAGPVELLTMLQEQSISACAHAHGLAIPVPGLDKP